MLGFNKTHLKYSIAPMAFPAQQSASTQDMVQDAKGGRTMREAFGNFKGGKLK